MSRREERNDQIESVLISSRNTDLEQLHIMLIRHQHEPQLFESVPDGIHGLKAFRGECEIVY